MRQWVIFHKLLDIEIGREMMDISLTQTHFYDLTELEEHHTVLCLCFSIHVAYFVIINDVDETIVFLFFFGEAIIRAVQLL